jgi:hypothetical protein
MKLYVDNNGVIRWNPNGWPSIDWGKAVTGDRYSDAAKIEYQQALSRAKAESVPVREQTNVYLAICCFLYPLFNIGNPTPTIGRGKLYEVPDKDIKKEWL